MRGVVALVAVLLAGCAGAGEPPGPGPEGTSSATRSGAAVAPAPALALPEVQVDGSTWQVDVVGLASGELGRFLLDVKEAPQAIALQPRDYNSSQAGAGYGYVLWPGAAPAEQAGCIGLEAVLFAVEGGRLLLALSDGRVPAGRHEVWVWQHGFASDLYFQLGSDQSGGNPAVAPTVDQWQMPRVASQSLGPVTAGSTAIDAPLAFVLSRGGAPLTDQATWNRTLQPTTAAGACPAVADNGEVTVVGDGPPNAELLVAGALTMLDYDLAWREGPAGPLLPGDASWELDVVAFQRSA